MRTFSMRTAGAGLAVAALAGAGIGLAPQASANSSSFGVASKGAETKVYWKTDRSGLTVDVKVTDTKCDGKFALGRLRLQPNGGGGGPIGYRPLFTFKNSKGCHKSITKRYHFSPKQLGADGRSGRLTASAHTGRDFVGIHWAEKTRYYDS